MKNNLKIAVDMDALSHNISQLPSDIKAAKLSKSEKKAVEKDVDEIIAQLETLKKAVKNG